MRVLYVIDSLIGGGAEHSLAHMAPGYRDLGIELHVAFLKSRWDVADDLRAAGATLHPVALDRGRARQLVAPRPPDPPRSIPTSCTRRCGRPTCSAGPPRRSRAFRR